jgi:hypothetical protein
MTTADTGTILRRVQALLAKADSTEFEEEAEALRVKANELIATHGISAAMLAAEGRQADALGSIKVEFSGAYTHNQAVLLGVIARVFSCKCVQHSMPGRRTVSSMTVVGYDSDLEIVNGLFQIINTQGMHGCASATPPPWEHGRTYRNSWWFGFNREISDRLKAAHASAMAQAQATSDGTSAALVLVDRSKRVEAYVGELFPSLGKVGRRTARSSSGYSSGRQAGARADIGQGRVGGSRTAIR